MDHLHLAEELLTEILHQDGGKQCTQCPMNMLGNVYYSLKGYSWPCSLGQKRTLFHHKTLFFTMHVVRLSQFKPNTPDVVRYNLQHNLLHPIPIGSRQYPSVAPWNRYDQVQHLRLIWFLSHTCCFTLIKVLVLSPISLQYWISVSCRHFLISKRAAELLADRQIWS